MYYTVDVGSACVVSLMFGSFENGKTFWGHLSSLSSVEFISAPLSRFGDARWASTFLIYFDMDEKAAAIMMKLGMA